MSFPLRGGDLFADVDANVGSYTILAALAVGPRESARLAGAIEPPFGFANV